MVYYEELGEYVVKYEVTFDKKEIEEIRDNISEKCTTIIHHSYIVSQENYNRLMLEGSKTFKNIHSKLIPGAAYQLEYDEYGEIELVKLMDELLNGNTKVINDLVNQPMIIKPKYSVEELSLELSKKLEELKIFPTVELSQTIVNIKNNLDNVKRFEKTEKITQEALTKYYSKIFSHIHLKEIERFRLDEITRVLDFLDGMNEDNINKKMSDTIKEKILRK